DGVREPALRDGLRACWSTPIRDHGTDRVFGTFAIYHRSPRVPTTVEITMVEQTGRLAGMAIKHNEVRQAQQRSEARFRALVQHAADITALLAPNGTIKYISPAVIDILGGDPEKIVGLRFLDYLHPEDRRATAAFLSDLRHGREMPSMRIEFRIPDNDGEWHWIEAIVTDLSHDENVGGIVVNARDITQRKDAEQQLHYLAATDALTRLPNRSHFAQRLTAAIDERGEGESGPTIIFLDLDYFKAVNDDYGHAVGDQLLVAVGERLQGALQRGDILARWGGDEFTILLQDRQEALPTSTRILAAFSRPFLIGPRTLAVSPSIGIATGAPGSDTARLVHEADLALYRAKTTRRACIAVFDPGRDYGATSLSGVSGGTFGSRIQIERSETSPSA
ncbi:MAG TPA: diguanylate cyclase, partial [Thermomicrobiales bacterium]|nr:diguanylate cyclase [Thermomicrobiales bacterium]